MANDPNNRNFKSVPKFFKDFQPHLPFRFVAQFFTGGDTAQYAAGLQFAISSLKFGSIDCDTSTGAFYFGNGYHTIPIYDTSSRTIDITFEETDDMQVIKLLDAIAEKQRFGLPYVVGIGITEFEEHMSKEVHQRLYVCVLSSYDEPSFSRSGGVSLVTVNATFNVMSEQLWTGAAPKSGFGEQAATNPNGGLAAELRGKADKTKSSGFGENMSQWAVDFAKDLAAGKKREADKAEEEEKKKGDEKKCSGGSGGGGSGESGGAAPGHERAKVTGGQFMQRDREAAKRNTFVKNNANPVKLTPAQTEQLKRIYNKTRGTLERGGKGDSFETWKRRFEQEHDATKANVDQILNNTEKTVDNTLKLQQKMKEQGYDIRLAGCADTYGALLGQHAESSEHNNGNKADIQIWKDGKAIDFKKATNDEVIAAQKAVANTNLVKTGVIEFNSDGGGAGWMDVNFTGDDWINSDGVRTDGVMKDTAHKGMTKASK